MGEDVKCGHSQTWWVEATKASAITSFCLRCHDVGMQQDVAEAQREEREDIERLIKAQPNVRVHSNLVWDLSGSGTEVKGAIDRIKLLAAIRSRGTATAPGEDLRMHGDDRTSFRCPPAAERAKEGESR